MVDEAHIPVETNKESKAFIIVHFRKSLTEIWIDHSWSRTGQSRHRQLSQKSKTGYVKNRCKTGSGVAAQQRYLV